MSRLTQNAAGAAGGALALIATPLPSPSPIRTVLLALVVLVLVELVGGTRTGDDEEEPAPRPEPRPVVRTTGPDGPHQAHDAPEAAGPRKPAEPAAPRRDVHVDLADLRGPRTARQACCPRCAAPAAVVTGELICGGCLHHESWRPGWAWPVTTLDPVRAAAAGEWRPERAGNTGPVRRIPSAHDQRDGA